MLAEQQDMYELTIKILTPPGSLKNSVSLEVTGQSGNATGKLESLKLIARLFPVVSEFICFLCRWH